MHRCGPSVPFYYADSFLSGGGCMLLLLIFLFLFLFPSTRALDAAVAAPAIIMLGSRVFSPLLPSPPSSPLFSAVAKNIKYQTARLPRYISRHPDPSAWHTDYYDLPSSKLSAADRLYLFPPPGTLRTALFKARTLRARGAAVAEEGEALALLRCGDGWWTEGMRDVGTWIRISADTAGSKSAADASRSVGDDGVWCPRQDGGWVAHPRDPPPSAGAQPGQTPGSSSGGGTAGRFRLVAIPFSFALL